MNAYASCILPATSALRFAGSASTKYLHFVPERGEFMPLRRAFLQLFNLSAQVLRIVRVEYGWYVDSKKEGR